MPSVVIRLDPSGMDAADLDLRYDIPDLLAKRAPGLIADDGYDYETDGSAMHIYLETSDNAKALPFIITLLENDRMCGNHLADAAMVGVSERAAVDSTEFNVVYPPADSGTVIRPRLSRTGSPTPSQDTPTKSDRDIRRGG